MRPILPSSRLVASAVPKRHRRHLPVSGRINWPIAPSLEAHPPPCHRRPFMSTSSLRQPVPREPPRGMSRDDLSPAAKIQAAGDGAWGWVVYRCAYADQFDARWQDVKRQIIQSLHQDIARSDAPGIADTMDFVFIEDPALDGASVAQVRHRFQAWARDACNYVDGRDTARGSRYEFFVMVDADAFRHRDIKLVRGWPVDEGLEEDGEEGGGAEDWVRLSDYSITTELYEELNNPELWYTFYTSPEEGLGRV